MVSGKLSHYTQEMAFISLFIIMMGITLSLVTFQKKLDELDVAQSRILARQEVLMNEELQNKQTLLLSQANTLKQVENTLATTKTDSEKAQAQLNVLSAAVQKQASTPKDIILSSSDISKYGTGVAQIMCVTPTGITSGSGSLWTFKELPYALVTNFHVIKDSTKCVASITNNSNNVTGLFALQNEIRTFNENTDEAILGIGASISPSSLPIANYNYSLPTLAKCSKLMPVGTPVVIIGYPAYAKRDAQVKIEGIGTVSTVYRTATNGIISGYDTSQKGEANYFVSAKIDSGNSGGIALAKDDKGICTLGLPTWVSVGNYETQGLVQNIYNILPKN